MDPRYYTRRNILQGAASVGVLGALGSTASAAQAAPLKPTLKKGSVILFQGDSITDEGRKKDIDAPNDTKALGRGYAAMAAGAIMADNVELELKFYNRGISGNKVPDLDARWQEDCINLKPDILSILIGVNDLWHTLAFGRKYKGTIEDYEKGYSALIDKTKKELPNCNIVICEPFTTRDSEDFKVLADYGAVAKKLATEKGLLFVPYQSIFDEVVKTAPAPFWLWDGIHPSVPGHTLMMQKWREVLGI